MSVACPICGAPVLQAFKPFCSDRCREVDLNRWLGGGYAIPASDQSPPDAANTNEYLSDDDGENPAD